jgi:hypothetical protein
MFQEKGILRSIASQDPSPYQIRILLCFFLADEGIESSMEASLRRVCGRQGTELDCKELKVPRHEWLVDLSTQMQGQHALRKCAPNRNALSNESRDVLRTAFAVEMNFKAEASRNSGDF